MAGSGQDVSETLRLARGIAMAQGGIFVRELLRKKRRSDASVRIGVTRPEVEANLVAAIRSGAISHEELVQWIDDVEGWGNQHVYLFRVRLPAGESWPSEAVFQRRAERAGLADPGDGGPGRTYPKDLTLTAATFAPERCVVTWGQRDEAWKRDDEKDKEPETIDGDRYEFRAYRRELSRSLMRFVLEPQQRRAALFVQLPLTVHEAALAEFARVHGVLFPRVEFQRLRISDAIKRLDQRELENVASGQESGRIEAQTTKFSAGGATVEFAADDPDGIWKRIPAVQNVRLALDEDSFSGEVGRFLVNLRTGVGLNRVVAMSLNGHSKRIYLWSQMTAEEVRVVLDQVVQCLR